MKFSPANTKLKKLAKVKALRGYLSNNRRIYSFDLLSGVKCPYSKECKSQAVEQPDGSLKIQDGKHTLFRCYSASQEALFKNVYKSRKENSKILEIVARDGYIKGANTLESLLPKNAGIIRIHSAGDYTTKNYMRSWLELAKRRPDILFYSYTKSIPFWLSLKMEIDNLSNFILTASYGGTKDNLISQHNLRSVKVVKSVYEAKKLKLPIDTNDSFAADPNKKNISYSLLVHGLQPSGSPYGKAVRKLKGKGSYGRSA